ncbi:MAG TPA: hypothetical protein VMZ00_05135 [Sporichthya sp.]|nr:hypothetical protein [Sporichthya sp.]
MSGKTRILGMGRSRGEGVAEVSEVSEVPAARIVEQRRAEDPLQDARDLEDAAMAYSEVVHVLGAITKTTQAGESAYAGLTLEEMADSLDRAWERWDKAQRRLIGPQRTG